MYILFLSDEGPMLETLDYTIRIGGIPTFLYFDMYILYIYPSIYIYIYIYNSHPSSRQRTELTPKLTATASVMAMACSPALPEPGWLLLRRNWCIKMENGNGVENLRWPVRDTFVPQNIRAFIETVNYSLQTTSASVKKVSFSVENESSSIEN